MQIFALLALLPAVALATPTGGKGPKYFTSGVSARAVPEQVVNNVSVSTPGQTGAFGHFQYYINSDLNTICYSIKTVGVTGEYSSPARTATHIHQGARGSAGPPRIAFPNPTFTRTNSQGAEIRESEGCLTAPFVTGVLVNGTDSGSASGFTLKALERNPTGFFTDTHTAAFTAGAVRGQLIPSEYPVRSPSWFTKVIKANATPNGIIATAPVAGAAVPGQAGAKGTWTLKINVPQNTLCYDIEVKGVTGFNLSPAKTSTHLHQAARGQAGPPRIAFVDPQERSGLLRFVDKYTKSRYSSECIHGPFSTGLFAANTSTDTGSSFTLKQLVDGPKGFFVDTHTEEFTQGAIRAQLA